MNSHLSLAVNPRFFKGVSPQSKALGFGLRHTVRPILATWSALPFRLSPPNIVDHIARLLPVHEGTMWRTVNLPDCMSDWLQAKGVPDILSLIHISEPTRQAEISYAVFCLKKKKK